MSAVTPWEQLPKQDVYITRHWRTRGIYRREAAVLTSGYYTNEDSGAGVHWTPYTIGLDCFLTVREAWSRVCHEIRKEEKEAERKQQQLDLAHELTKKTFLTYFNPNDSEA